MSILHLTLCTALVALASAAAGPECWYTDPLAVCNHDVDDTMVDIDINTHTDLDQQRTFCQKECERHAEVDAPLADCQHFTVRPMRGVPKCYLMSTCTKNTEDGCLDEGLCGGGLGDCDDQTGCAPLPAFDAPNDDKIRWICDHVDNPYDTDGEIPVGTACTLSCEGWVDANGDTVNVVSTCDADFGVSTTYSWTAPVIKAPGAGDGDTVDQATVPALADKTLPSPDDVPDDQIGCGCGPRPMAWDPEGDNINYDPNLMPGTTFICQNGDYLVGADGSKEFIIAEDMTCRLYCDGYHVATMECLNGDWTGEPELGAWCYYPPTADDDVNSTPATTTTGTL